MSCETRDLTIRADASWSQSHWLMDGNQPVDLTLKEVELRVLPVFDWAATPIRVLTSQAGGEISIDDAATGAITISVSQANVASGIPPGEWVYFLRVLNGGDVTEYLRGNLTVLAGRTS